MVQAVRRVGSFSDRRGQDGWLGHPKRRKIIHELIARKVTWLLLFEIGCITCLIVSRSVLLNNVPMEIEFTYCGFMVLLIGFEKAQWQPFPFMRNLEQDEFVKVLTLGVVWQLLWLSFVARLLCFVTPISMIGIPQLPVTIAVSLHAGITEESMKVGITYVGGLIAFRVKPSYKMTGLAISGITASAIWALLHFLNGYPPVVIVLLFLTGIGLIALVFWKKNYLPVVLAHALVDFIILAKNAPCFLQ